MNLKTILKTSIIATTAMTLYSYVLSAIKDENFSEPQTLAELIHRLMPGIKRKNAATVGWSIHYLVGVVFAVCYIYLWEKKKILPTVQNGLLLGGMSGLIAMLVWKTVIEIHPNPPRRHYKNYYMQLLPAHIVFGIVAAMVYSLAGDDWRSLSEPEKSGF